MSRVFCLLVFVTEACNWLLLIYCCMCGCSLSVSFLFGFLLHFMCNWFLLCRVLVLVRCFVHFLFVLFSVLVLCLVVFLVLFACLSFGSCLFPLCLRMCFKSNVLFFFVCICGRCLWLLFFALCVVASYGSVVRLSLLLLCVLVYAEFLFILVSPRVVVCVV